MTTSMGGQIRRPDDPAPRPTHVRPKPARRSLALRLLVTVLAAGLLYDSWMWVNTDGGPERAFLMIYAALAAGFALLALAWAWKRHQF